MTLYLDMDGVAVDFKRGYREHFGYEADTVLDNVDWDLVRTVPHFYRDLPPMPDFHVLWDAVKHVQPVFLTGVPNAMPDEAAAQKRAWLDRVLGQDVKMIPCRAREKYLLATNTSLGGSITRPNTLVDDWTKYRHRWVGAGGHWVTHIDAPTTILRLQDLWVIH